MKTTPFVLFAAITSLLTIKLNAFEGNTNNKVMYNVRPAYRAIASSELTKNIEYDFSKASIRSTYYDHLNKLAKFLIDNKYPLALRGYADSIGGFKANWKLSDERAVFVKKYLVKMGVSDNKIVTTPFGSTKPIASNKTIGGRQRNRRVEIKISQI